MPRLSRPPLTWKSRVTTGEPGRSPVRTCVGCRQRATPAELVRVVRAVDGSLVISRTAPGRGAWLCAGSVPCLEQAVRRRAFDRALRTAVGSGAIEALRAAFFELAEQNVRDCSAAGQTPGAARPPWTPDSTGTTKG